MNNVKKCSKCGRELPLSEFHKDKTKKDGLQSYCKDCKKQHYQANREEIAAYGKQWRAEHADYFNDYFKQWRAEHADYGKQYNAEWYTTIEGYAYSIRHSNLQNDRKYGRCGMDEDPLPPHSYYIEKFSEGIDYYDGKKHPFNELGFDRIDDNLPHTIDNMVVATTFHNVDRWHKRMSVEEYKAYIQNEELTLACG